MKCFEVSQKYFQPPLASVCVRVGVCVCVCMRGRRAATKRLKLLLLLPLPPLNSPFLVFLLAPRCVITFAPLLKCQGINRGVAGDGEEVIAIKCQLTHLSVVVVVVVVAIKCSAQNRNKSKAGKWQTQNRLVEGRAGGVALPAWAGEGQMLLSI